MDKTYAEKLKDPRWQRKRNGILERDNYTCQKCGDTKTTLHVHHKKYINGNDPWDYPDADLITLCASCHSWINSLKNIEIFDAMKILTIDCEGIYLKIVQGPDPNNGIVVSFKDEDCNISGTHLTIKQVNRILNFLQNK